jgi:hypothetical protein
MSEPRWKPKVGDMVWANYPDCDSPEGRVVGYVKDGVRKGQPIIERMADIPDFWRGVQKKGTQVVMHPMFLLPFRFGGPEWKKAEAEGLIR